jgi:hypothetical protein
MKMGVGLIQKKDVDARICGEREHAEPLKETASLHHEIAVVVALVTLDLEAVDSALDYLNLDV